MFLCLSVASSPIDSAFYSFVKMTAFLSPYDVLNFMTSTSRVDEARGSFFSSDRNTGETRFQMKVCVDVGILILYGKIETQNNHHKRCPVNVSREILSKFHYQSRIDFFSIWNFDETLNITPHLQTF